MHFQIQLLRGPRDISPVIRRGKFHLDRSHPMTCFIADPKATVMTTQSRCSVWQPLSMLLHILEINDDLRSKDPEGTSFKTTTDGTKITSQQSLLVGQSDTMFSNMCPHYWFDISISMICETWPSINTCASSWIIIVPHNDKKLGIILG